MREIRRGRDRTASGRLVPGQLQRPVPTPGSWYPEHRLQWITRSIWSATQKSAAARRYKEFLIGIPDVIVDRLKEYVALGASHFRLWFMDFPSLSGIRFFEVGHTAEFLRVVGYQACAKAQRLRRDEHVQRPEGSTLLLEYGPQVPVGACSLTLEGRDGKRRQKPIQRFMVLLGPPALARSVPELCDRDNGDSNVIGSRSE
jgi:hypothetical protein